MKKICLVVFFLTTLFAPSPVLAFSNLEKGCTQTPMINVPVYVMMNVPVIVIPGVIDHWTKVSSGIIDHWTEVPAKDELGNTVKDVPSLACLAQVVVNVINYALMFLGTVTFVMLAFGAIRFITSTGDPKGIQSAQKTMLYAGLGAIAVLGMVILINVVTNALSLPSILTNFSFFRNGP